MLIDAKVEGSIPSLAANITSEEIQNLVHLELLKDQFKSSLFLTAKYLCGFNEITLNTHGHMIQNLESDTKRKLIVMPRGTFKSSIGVVAYAIWLLIRNPNERIMIDSEKYANSKNFIRQIKLILESPPCCSNLWFPYRHSMGRR
jgi:hypothetical protein